MAARLLDQAPGAVRRHAPGTGESPAFQAQADVWNLPPCEDGAPMFGFPPYLGPPEPGRGAAGVHAPSALGQLKLLFALVPPPLSGVAGRAQSVGHLPLWRGANAFHDGGPTAARVRDRDPRPAR